jgi:hypothetical protein
MAEIWLKFLASRRNDPVEQTTIDTRTYGLDKWLLPAIGEKYRKRKPRAVWTEGLR